MPAYSDTSVPVERSKEAIRKLLIQHQARGVQFTEEFPTPAQSGRIHVRFAKEVEGNLRTVSVALEVPRPPEPKRARTKNYYSHGRSHAPKSAADRHEQMYRATYRALHWWLKSQFEAVEFGLLSFEDVFLSHFEWMVGDKVTTVGALIKPRLPSGSNLLAAPDGDVIDAEYQA